MSNNANHLELPDGWKLEPLSALGEWRGGGTPSKRRSEYWDNGTIPWLSPKDMKHHVLEGTKNKITQAAVENSAAKEFRANSIAIVVRSGILKHTLPIALVPFSATANQDMRVLTPREGMDPHWLLYALLGHADVIRRTCSKDGTTVSSIDVARLMRYGIPVPSHDIQKARVNLVVRQLESLAEGELSIKEVKASISIFRQSVAISEFRRRRPQQQELTLGQLCERVGGRIQTGPFGSQLHASDYTPSGTPVVMPKNLDYGAISTKEIAHVEDRDVQRLARHTIKVGDILQSRRGDLRRRALVTETEEGWLCGTGCFVIRLGDIELARFVNEHLNEPHTASILAKEAVGVTMPNLNAAILKSTPIFLPSSSIRKAMLREIEIRDRQIEELKAILEKCSTKSKVLKRLVVAEVSRPG